MEFSDFLPLGSIVLVTGGIKKLMIISRSVTVPIHGKQLYFDYGACAYPEGMIGNKALYFNHTQIARVIHEGYVNEDNEYFLDVCRDWLEKNTIERGDPGELLKTQI